MRINLCIIDEGDARDKVTYQKSVERRNNIRCDWLVRTSNYTNCNQNHTLIMKNLDHTWRLEEIQCFQSLREFLSCYIWNCIVSSVATCIFQIYVPVLSSVWNFILKGYTRCCCFHDAEWSVIRRQRNVMRILRSPMLN